MLSKPFLKSLYALRLIQQGRILFLLRKIWNKIYSEKVLFALELDIISELKEPKSLIEISIRPFRRDDAIHFKDDDENISLLEQLPQCYVAVTKQGIPCFRQWLIKSSHNNQISKFWGESYPKLKNDEALLESGFTIPKYRGLGVMPLALYKISIKAKEEGIRKLYVSAPITNISSLRAMNYIGIKPFKIIRENYRFFIKTVFSEEIPKELMAYYNKITKLRKE